MKNLEWESNFEAVTSGIGLNSAVNSAKLNTREGIMIATVRDKSADGNVRDVDGVAHDTVVPSHELSWEMWRRQVEADDGDISSLKFLIADSVQGQGTLDTIQNAMGKLHLSYPTNNSPSN